MSKQLFLLCGLITLGLSACATHTNPERYALTSCDNLRALQAAYERDVNITAKPPTDGINALDRRGRQETAAGNPQKDYRALSRSARADIDSIRAAYRQNKCTDKTDRL